MGLATPLLPCGPLYAMMGIGLLSGSPIRGAELMLAFGRSTSGIDFESMDGQPAHLFFLLLAPEESVGVHLKALARISRFFRDASFREKLLLASDLDTIFRAIEEEDAKF